MPTVAVINYKGGVGKTTIVANIAAELAWRGKRVLLVDLDPQASLNFNIVTKTAIVASSDILIPAIPDHLSTLGIEELRRHVAELADDFNGYAEQDSRATISPSIVGVAPTMVQLYRGQPISRQAPFIDQIKHSGVSVFDTYIRRNNTMHGDAPLYGVPVVLQDVSGGTYKAVRSELENLTTEFLARLR